MRERRIMLGLTQQQMAERIGVTYQQAHKYEKGINRIASGRLYNIAQALGVDVGYFFEGLDSDKAAQGGAAAAAAAGVGAKRLFGRASQAPRGDLFDDARAVRSRRRALTCAHARDVSPLTP
jgi:transcriptional regulator with XRE-family HTH domain